ncbi:cytochrome P450 736A117-like [Silene latifolia]|uniref:cytochrome P450 736A117-like n=1 Tax=Silene latifolia TaxID=37657 RepID=UPI003D78199F
MSKRYGDVMLLHLGNIPALIVSSERAAREILKTNEAMFCDRPKPKRGNKLLYNCKGLGLSPYGEHWRRMKTICTLHLLGNAKVRSFSNVREDEMSLVIQKIIQAGTRPINLTDMFTDFANNIICMVAFGRKYTKEEDGVNLGELLQEMTETLAAFNVGDFVPQLAWMNRFNGWNAKTDGISTKLDGFIEMVVQQHRDHVREDETPVNNFVDALLEIHNDHHARFQVDTECVKALILDMFIGATESTSALLEWAMAELLKNPKVMQEVQKEVREITRDRSEVKEEELEQMKYLKSVIKETLRLHPPTPLLIPRQSTQDARVDGYDIPAGTACFFNVWAMHRDPAFWDQPDKFNPERFLSSGIEFRGHDFQFIPFGAGRRMCPGIGFSMASIEFLLANIINKFDWLIPEGEALDMSECFRITLHKSTPLLAVAAPH